MLCDQDDVWLPEKIELTLAKMYEMESEFGTEAPLLVHTDLRVVDEKLETISVSYKDAMNADYGKTKLRNQVIQNTLTGCTVMYNRALADLIAEIPPYIVMHDWWLMLIASTFGKITSVDEQTVLYRQHGGNIIGAKNVRSLQYIAHKLAHNSEIKMVLNETYMQAKSLLVIFEFKLTMKQKELLTSYCDIPNRCKLMRWVTICRLGVFKNGVARRIALFIFI